MSYTVDWLLPNEIIKITYHEVVTVEDLREIRQATELLMLESRNSRVHILVDLMLARKVPMALKDQREAFFQDRRGIGWILVITNNAIMRFMSTVLGKLMQANIKMFATLPLALSFLARYEAGMDVILQPLINIYAELEDNI